MKRLIAAIILLGVSVAARAQDPDSVAFVNADWKITELERGAEAMYASIPMFNSIQSICVIKYPARKFRTEILAREGKKLISRAESERKSERPLFSMQATSI